MDFGINSNFWCQSLENVLNDGDALQAFLGWARSENAEHPLRFHFSVVAFKEMLQRGDEKSAKLAREIYRKYLEPQRGVCQFVELTVRQAVGQKLANEVHESGLEEELFDACLPYIHAFLRRQHSQFVTSDAFIEFLNSQQDENASNRPSTSAIECPPAAACTPVAPRRVTTAATSRKHREQQSNNLLLTKKLTPEILLRSQRERELILGQSFLEKAFQSQPPLTKYPYVCNATTSKNDSAVSSNFSSEANSHHHQRKNANNAYSTSSQQSARSSHHHQTHNQHSIHSQQSQQQQRANTLGNRLENGSCFRHESEEGRREFANALSKRLHELDEKINRNERMNEQIQRIDTRAMFSARDVVIASEMKVPSYGLDDEDEDLNNYVKQKMIDESGKPSPSQQQSPAGCAQTSTAPKLPPRRRSPKSCSPDYFPQHPAAKFGLMSQSYFEPQHHHQPQVRRQLANFSTRFPQQYGAAIKPLATDFDQISSTRFHDFDEDTSGIGSMATTQFSSSSAHNPPTSLNRERKDPQKHGAGRGSKSSGFTRRNRATNAPPPAATGTEFSDFTSLQRQRNDNSGLMKISYKAADGVPVIAFVPQQQLNFRDFRKYFSISSKSRKHFFFKAKCDDNSAPYQLLLVEDDSIVLPIFEGTIAAECRSMCESE